jgi:hypothetical protein
MDAAGRNGIPSAFLVDTKGMIAWIGHPMELEAKTIDAALAGKPAGNTAKLQTKQPGRS